MPLDMRAVELITPGPGLPTQAARGLRAQGRIRGDDDEVLHRVHREHSGNGSSFFSIFLVRIEEVRRTSLKRGGERKKGGRLQMVRFKNRYFVVEVIWDEAFEVC